MIPLLIAAGAAAAGSGIANAMVNQSASDRAAMFQDKSIQEWLKLKIPDPKEQEIALEKFITQGELVPSLERAIAQDPSAFEQIVTDPGYKAAQNRSLAALEQIGNDGGMRLQDKAALQDAMMDSQVQERAGRQAIAADMSRRGMGGSGFEVAAQLAGQQGVADRNANSSLKAAAMAQERALQAIESGGELAGKYRAQDFGERAQKASAADRISEFNTKNLRDVNSANVGAQNAANLYNVQQRQKTADQNTQLSNAQQMHNKGLVQQQFENQAKKTGGMTGQYGQAAQGAINSGQMMGNAITNIGSGVSGALASQAQYDLMDQYLKKKQS